MVTGVKYNVFYIPEERYLYTNCVLEAVIPSFHYLSDNEVRKYFKIDENHRNWGKPIRQSRFPRYVFDKCVVPDSRQFRIEVVY